MEKQRAQEIINSPDKIAVFHQGKAVWIEGIESTTANVTVMGTCHTMNVPFQELKEN
ncbi:MAG: H-type small acid-soluble spore protein [Firmicutes bacterium]|nr:H-type small acid-soluble spore protein [Bacillota bacterium]